MALEYVPGGEFFTHLRKAGRFNNHTTKFYAAQITLIFEYLHLDKIIYRDLKPENLLLDREGYLKITDFGFAKRVEFKTYTLCGTPEYIAPEVLLNKGHNKGVDWWTLGILNYEMLAGQPPFVDDDPMGIYQKILSGNLVFPRYFDRSARSLIKKLLTADLTKRYGCLKGGANDVKNHKWNLKFDWTSLYHRAIPAPLIPTVGGLTGAFLSCSVDAKRANERARRTCRYSPLLPLLPHRPGTTDTSNFDAYPDSVEEARLPAIGGRDPFLDF